MWVLLLVFASMACVGLIAALRPGASIYYFFTESQRKALSGQLKFISAFGWVFLCGSVLMAIIPFFGSELKFLAAIVGPLLFLVCAAAYLWWGIWLVRSPDSFLKRATGRLSRLPIWCVRAFGSGLLVGAIGFLYGFVRRLLR
jgi:hypothetical protein